ncbi:MAG TPA: carboxylesterase/lipase family protein [Acidimicrobiales bacterium]|nr:carboxylesterase/lipase family protein [Acidimicrobiales bacterium]
MPDPVVETRFATLRGRDEEGLAVFRGIAYASAPVGRLRFRPPVAPQRRVGVIDAAEFGPIAPQPVNGLGSYVPGDPVAQDEDCLTLNVWTPACDDMRRPVMVFIHGGAFLTGSGSSALYRADALARRGVVVVTGNYRLGALGFLAHPLLTDGATRGFANWGLHDVVAALRWVRDHATSFGGDPRNVTVFGESAGAMAIADLLGAPAARGLFRRAILESGACVALPVAPAVSMAERLGAALGLDEPSRDRLEHVPVADLLAAQRELSGSVDHGLGIPFPPVVDGGLLPRPPEDAVADGGASAVDLLVGTNRDEFKFFAFAGGDLDRIDAGGAEAVVESYLAGAGLGPSRPSAREVLDHYRGARAGRGDPVDDFELLCAVAGDWIFRIPALRLATAHAARSAATYTYLFDWESPFAKGVLGSCHALELPFVFGTLRNPIIGLFAGSGPDALALSDAVQEAWVAFAARGDPSTETLGTWPRYVPAKRSTMVLGARCAVQDGPFEPERQFWESRLGRYGRGGPIEGAVPPSVSLLAEPGTDGGAVERWGT